MLLVCPVGLWQEFGIAAEDARQKVQEKFSLTAEEADGLMEKYWK